MRKREREIEERKKYKNCMFFCWRVVMSVCVRKLRKIESGTKLDRVARVKEKSRNVETKTVKLREKQNE